MALDRYAAFDLAIPVGTKNAPLVVVKINCRTLNNPRTQFLIGKALAGC
jgi:hypothetical protein